MPPENNSPQIQARLSTFDTAMVVFSLVVGIGIFRTPAIVAGAAGDASLFFTAWIAGGLVSLIGALTFAEIGSRYPRAGGYYRVVADCYHPTLAFMLNWSQTLMQGAGAAGVAFIGADYLMPVLLPASWRTPHASLALACGTMLLLLILNYRGVKPGARAQNLLSTLKIVMIVGLGVLGLLLAQRVQLPAAGIDHERRTAAGLGTDSVLLRLRRLSHDDESGSRPQGCPAALSACHHRRHADRGGAVSAAQLRV